MHSLGDTRLVPFQLKLLMVQAGLYIDDGSGLSGTESLPGSAEKGKAPAEALLRAETLKRRCIKVQHFATSGAALLTGRPSQLCCSSLAGQQ